jgi:hypothetical protein
MSAHGTAPTRRAMVGQRFRPPGPRRPVSEWVTDPPWSDPEWLLPGLMRPRSAVWETGAEASAVVGAPRPLQAFIVDDDAAMRVLPCASWRLRARHHRRRRSRWRQRSRRPDRRPPSGRRRVRRRAARDGRARGAQRGPPASDLTSPRLLQGTDIGPLEVTVGLSASTWPRNASRPPRRRGRVVRVPTEASRRAVAPGLGRGGRTPGSACAVGSLRLVGDSCHARMERGLGAHLVHTRRPNDDDQRPMSEPSEAGSAGQRDDRQMTRTNGMVPATCSGT